MLLPSSREGAREARQESGNPDLTIDDLRQDPDALDTCVLVVAVADPLCSTASTAPATGR